MTKKTKCQIRNYLKNQIPVITEEDLNDAETREFQRDNMVHLAERYKVADPEALATSIDGMKEPTARVAMPTVKESMPTDSPDVAAAPERKWWTSRNAVLGLMGVLILILGAESFLNNDLDDLKKEVASVKAEVAKKADTAYVKEGLFKLDMKVELADQTLKQSIDQKLNDDIAKLKADLNSKADKDDMAKKADKTDLSRLATRKRLKRVEEKLEEHLLVEKARETLPLASAEQPAPFIPGKMDVVVPPEKE